MGEGLAVLTVVGIGVMALVLWGLRLQKTMMADDDIDLKKIKRINFPPLI